MNDKNKKCPLCSAFFNSIYSLHLHCVENHHKRFVCCPICYEPLKNSLSNDDLAMHSNLFHERRAKQFIGINTEDFASYMTYQFNAHMINGSKCMACPKILANRTSAGRHYKTVHLTIKYICHLCSRGFIALRTLRHHYNVHSTSKSTNDYMGLLQGFAGFDVIEKTKAIMAVEERDNVIQPQVMKMKPRVNGIRILHNLLQFVPSSCGPRMKLTSGNKNHSVKLLPFVMNDANEFIDLTSNDEEEIN